MLVSKYFTTYLEIMDCNLSRPGFKNAKDEAQLTHSTAFTALVLPASAARCSAERRQQSPQLVENIISPSLVSDLITRTKYEYWEIHPNQVKGFQAWDSTRKFVQVRANPPDMAVLENIGLDPALSDFLDFTGGHFKFRHVFRLISDRRACNRDSGLKVTLLGTKEISRRRHPSLRKMAVFLSIEGEANTAPIAEICGKVRVDKEFGTGGSQQYVREPHTSEYLTFAGKSVKRKRLEVSVNPEDSDTSLGGIDDKQRPGKLRRLSDGYSPPEDTKLVSKTEVYLDKISTTDSMKQVWSSDMSDRKYDETSMANSRSDMMLDCISITSSMRRMLTPAVHNRSSAIREETDEEDEWVTSDSVSKAKSTRGKASKAGSRGMWA